MKKVFAALAALAMMAAVVSCEYDSPDTGFSKPQQSRMTTVRS